MTWDAWGTGTLTASGLIDTNGALINRRLELVPDVQGTIRYPAGMALPEKATAPIVRGAVSVVVPATDDPDANPSGWTWRVRIRANGNSMVPTQWVDGFHVAVPAGAVVDLWAAAHVAPSAGAPAPMAGDAVLTGAGAPSDAAPEGRLYFDVTTSTLYQMGA